MSSIKKLEQYELIHRMNYTMYKVFKTYLHFEEYISYENMLGGSYGDEHELTIFNISESKATRIQRIQDEMLKQ